MKFVIALSLLLSIPVFAEEISVIEVRRNIPLADEDPIYKDFYLNAGPESGLKKNLVIMAVRKIFIKDATGTSSYGELVIPVGLLKVIAVQNRIAVAREFKLISRDDEPMLDQIGIMTGDKIEMSGSYVDNKKASVKKTK